MAKSTPSQLDRSRPSSRLQAQTMLETTPVLFRLPSVQLQPLPPVADMPTESLMEFAAAPMPEASPSPASLPVSITSQPMEADEPPRTWWEHWSSGVILILLLVAAYFACIAVLRSRGRAGSNTIATDSSSKSEFGDLNDMKIPPVTTAPGTATGNQLNQPAALTANDSIAADALVNSLVSPPSSNGFSSDNSNTLTLENPAKELAQPQAQPLATAQLLEPLQMPNNSLQLLNDRDVSNNNGVQAQSASMQLGQSPSLYDGASNSTGGLSPLAEPSLPPFTPASLNPNSFALDTNAPSLSPALNNPALTNPTLSSPTLSSPAATGSTTYGQAYPASPTIPNLVAGTMNPGSANPSSTSPSGSNPGAPSLGVNASTVSTQQLPAGQATPSNVRTTVTPEANGEVESIIKAYVDLMRAGQASQSANTQNAPANRYQPVR
jgi:hypothetical protein